MSTIQQTPLQIVQGLVAEYQNGNPEGYLAGVADDFKGSVLGGLLPGADNITSKADFMKVMEIMPTYMDVKKFAPHTWRAVNNDVMFTVDWEFVWLPTGKTVKTTALVRKVVNADGKLCEKYHMVDTEAITGEKKAPHDASTVTRVQELLGCIAAGKPEGYLAGVADDIQGSVLGGLIPGGDAFTCKADFAALMGKQGEYMEVRKFEPVEFRALPNNDMMFNVNWKFKWLPTGEEIETTAVVRKVLDKDGNICEKYHMLDEALIAQLAVSPRGVIDKSPSPAFGATTPFILIARCHVKPDQRDAYLEAARVADAAVQASEPGMLHHTFDQDPDDPLAFVWSEVYASDAALLAHLTNPPLVKFVEQHTEMGDGFSIEVYGTLADETKKAFSASGFPIKYFDTKLGYSRVAGK